MAAYGALVSVMQIMDQIRRHPHPPISIHEEQVESLTSNVTFLQEFLEGYNPHLSYTAEADPLESRIAEAAYTAKDVIQSYIVDQIHAPSTDHSEEIIPVESLEGYNPHHNYSSEADLLWSRILEEEEAYAAEDVIESDIIDQILGRSSDHAEDVSSTEFYQDVIESEIVDQIHARSIDHSEEISPVESLEGYNPHLNYSSEADPLESRIAEAAYAAEDVIESYIVDQIHSRSSDHAEETRLLELEGGINLHLSSEADRLDNLIAAAPTNDGEKISCIEFIQCVPKLMSYIAHTIQQLLQGYHPRVTYSSAQFYQGLQKVIEKMDLIKMEIEEKMKDKTKMGVQIIRKSTTDVAGPLQSSSTAQKVTTMVGLDDVLYKMLDTITGGERVRKIIPIVGMGGLGKTTLAQNIYANALVKEHFDICAWATISQVHSARKILSEILDQVGLHNGGDLSEYELGEKLYRYLIGRRYLIVMDDMWNIEAWDVVRIFFPENENGSRVVVTTRLSNLASQFNYSYGLDMKFWDESSSWDLFSQIVFGKEIYPRELEDIGKKIVEGCRGLPLSIVVVGGLLSKSKPTRENWKLVEENLSSVVNLESDGSCLQILYVSYINLPVYLKPCFLYMGVFPEDDVIIVYLLITQWVAEGFIKSFDGKSLEETAEDYIEELVDRNLILVEGRDHCGKMESVKIHDLLRDLALREGEKDKFSCALMQSTDHWEISHGTIISTQRRIATSFDEELLESPEPASSLVRSLIGKFQKSFPISDFRISRCMFVSHHAQEESSDEHYEEIFIPLANMRLILVDVKELPSSRISSWASFFWNLQTLYFSNVGEDYVLHIWKMPLLRHVMITDNFGALCLSDPPLSGDDMDEVVLEYLQTLYVVKNLILSENV